MIKYMIELFTPFLVAGIVIAIIAGKQRYKDNKIIRDFYEDNHDSKNI